MRVVVTGATGNVGSAVIERLAADDSITAIVGIARRAPDWRPPKTEWEQLDLVKDALEPVFDGADAVVHLAWIFQPTHDPIATWENNVMGAWRVFDATAGARVPALVHASSVGAYSPGPREGTVDESWPTHSWPTAAYGREKAYVERLLDEFALRHPDVRVVRLRPGFIFQRWSAAEQRRLFAGPFLPGRAVRPAVVPVVPDLPGLRLQGLHADDVAEAYRLAVVRDVSGPFNVAAPGLIDAAALAELFDARVVPVPRWAARAAVRALWRLHLVPASPELLDLALTIPVMDVTRARTELGWEPTVSGIDALAEMIQGMREGAGGPTPPLASDAGGTARVGELRTGIGEVGGVTGDGR